MTESNPIKSESNRRSALVAMAGGSVLGAISSLFVGEARAQDGGAAAAQIGVLIQKFGEYRQQFSEYSGIVSNIKNTITEGVDKYFEWTEDMWRLHDEINGLMTAAPGLGTQIKQLPAELVAHIKRRFDEVDELIKAYETSAKGKPNTRHNLAFRARAKLGRSLGEVSAKNLRERYAKLASSVEKNRSRKKSKGEIFREGAAPLDSEVRLGMYESMLRLEAKIDRLFELQSNQEFFEAVKPLTKKDVEKSFEEMKKGKGTLLDEGE